MHEYQKRLVRAARDGGIAFADVERALVRHDPWCGFFRLEFCDCSPEIFVTYSDGIVHIGPDGLTEFEYAH